MSTKCDHRHHRNNHHFRLWNSFSTASFRRKLLSTITCGLTAAVATTTKSAALKPEQPPDRAGSARSERLYDLLNLSSSSAASSREHDAAEQRRRKEERLAEMTAAVRWLQSGDVVERENGAKSVRNLTKEDGEARSTLAMLGAIPPLVQIIDHNHDDDDDDDRFHECLIQALYALLNLGIANDL